ncbi:hypothetical protein GB931_06570 [Modestobacter sp. I12A-02628]|uniref:Uncharacterized protein n=1 Tax=Goekera deserti TaxID=2497753 RepID=A0A7K3WB53_9ACTN|nr:hypothetical protein [Goekera deserti]MPQ97587.1 hypothetical protein [Goekera deserti]NDI47809.1 hypothetical protein [Goekera deserti]NEL53557.1 hypothetical protein [Goekera deserti]
MTSPAALGASLVCTAQQRLDAERPAVPALVYGLSVGLAAVLAVAGIGAGLSSDVVLTLLESVPAAR